MSKVVHFEFASPDPAADMAFFGELFGWKSERWGEMDYYTVDTGEGPGINGAIQPMDSPEQPRTVTVIGVGDIDASLATALANGATIALDKTEVPGVGWTAYLLSPTGIMFGMIQPLPGSTM